MFETVFPLASLDVIPQEMSSDLIFSFSKNDHPYNQRLNDLGFE